MAARPLAAFSALVLVLVLAGCGVRPRAPAPRLVILYVACTVNKDFLAPYAPPHGPGVRYTPAFQELARESVVFQRHVTECGQSGVDFATLFTGTQADRHGIYYHPSTLEEENQLLAESLAAAGYDAWFWSGHPMASAELGYGQGVAPERLVLRERAFPRVPKERIADESFLASLTANDAEFAGLLERLRADPDYRAYVQIAFTISHEPYHQYATLERALAFLARFPEAGHGVTRAELERWLPVYEAERHGLNWDFPATRERLGLSDADVERLAAVLEVLYATCLHQLDAFLGRLLTSVESSGLAGECVFSFTTDHGESLYQEHELFHWTHGPQLSSAVLDVPWILRAPGIEPAEYAEVTRSIDVFPTLLGLCGLPAPGFVQGSDLAPALRGERPAPRALAFSHTPLWPEDQVERFVSYPLIRAHLPRTDPALLSVRARDGDRVFKLRRSADGEFRDEVFDLARDPRETTDLHDPLDPEQRAMGEELARYKARLVAAFGAQDSGLSEEETLERLRALGYVR